MPPIETFPKSHIVTFHYYLGVILFLDENYVQVPVFPATRNLHHAQPDYLPLAPFQAEENLTNALNMCHRDAYRNKE